MIKFNKEKVLLLHQLITAETGGDPNIRDVDLLESALESAFATFDGHIIFRYILSLHQKLEGHLHACPP